VRGRGLSPAALDDHPVMIFCTHLKAGPAGGRLRRPSSRRQRHDDHRGTGLALCTRPAIADMREGGWLMRQYADQGRPPGHHNVDPMR
jgi:hypothetical protein